MNKIMTILIVVFTTVITASSSKVFSAESQHSFKAANHSNDTKICLAAASDNLSALKSSLRRVSGIADGASNTTKTKYGLATIQCNDLDIVAFTNQFQASDTLKYINRRAPLKYRIDNNVTITDLAKLAPQHNEIILISANR